MAVDIKKWLRDEMGFTDAAQIDEIASKFTNDHAAKLEAGYVASSDRAAVAAARTEIETQKAALKTANDKLNAELAEWASMTAAEKAEAGALRADLHASQQRVLALEQSVSTIAAQAGIDPKTVLPEPAKVEKVMEKQPAGVDPSKFVSADQFAQIMQFQVNLPAALQYIADSHRELTGKTLDTRTIVAEIQKRAGQKDAIVDPVKIWEELHNIPTLRATKDSEARAAEIAAAEARGEERARSSMAIPGASTTRSSRPSPVLGMRDASGHMGQRTSVLKRPQPETGVMAAAAAFRSGKYRGEKVS